MDTQEAQDRWLKRPAYGGALWRLTGDPREEDAPDFHQAHQALTRLAEPTVSLVLLHGTEGRPCLDSRRDEEIDTKVEPTAEQAARLLKRSVSMADKRIVFDLMSMPVPPGWRLSPLLRHHRAVTLDRDGGAAIGSHYFRVDDEIGLCVAH